VRPKVEPSCELSHPAGNLQHFFLTNGAGINILQQKKKKNFKSGEKANWGKFLFFLGRRRIPSRNVAPQNIDAIQSRKAQNLGSSLHKHK
jgi:hypothetical protein